MLDMLVLVLATCCDSFFMSVAYGVKKIRIPATAMIVIAFCGTMVLGVSLTLAGWVSHVVSDEFGKWISFAILLVLALTSLFQGQVKHYVKKHKNRPLIIRFQGISFVVDIFLDETEADQDHSKELSVKEAFYLGVALSLDSFGSGLAYGIGFTDVFVLLCISFAAGVLAIWSGSAIGKRVVHHFQGDISWISGCLLLVLAFLRLKS